MADVSCKYCKNYHPAGAVENGDFSACKIDNRMYANHPQSAMFGNRIDPMMDAVGKNYKRDCIDFNGINWLSKILRNYHYNLVCGFSDTPFSPEEIHVMAERVSRGEKL